MTSIIESNIVFQSTKDMKEYAKEVYSNRALPTIDGLKPIHKKVIYCLFHDFPKTRRQETVKSASMVGTVLYKYSPHGDTSTYLAAAALSNWFQNYMPLIKGQGGLGSIYKGVSGASAYRYTEMGLSKFCMDAVLADLVETDKSVDWMDNYSNTEKEPKFLPVKIPLLLINGSFSIGVGLRSQIPTHNINEVIDATIKLIDDPDAEIVLIPDDCQGSDIVASDFEKISKTGVGKYKTRAKIEISEEHGRPTLTITSLPDLVTFAPIKEKIEKLKENNVLPQIVDVLHQTSIDFKNKKSDNEVFKVQIILKKGSDPKYVMNVLYSSTDLEKTNSVDFEVLYKDNPVLFNYKQYLQTFIEFRKNIKMRIFAARLKECKTRMHKLWLYIYVLTSGKDSDVINLIRKQKSSDINEIIDAMMKLLPKTTPVQCRELLNTQLYKLSKGNLQKYQEEYAELEKLSEDYYKKSVHGEGVYQIIKEELLDIKQKYGFPRKSKVLSTAEINNIPEGIFKVIITEKGYIKKLDQSDKTLGLRDDRAIFSVMVDNTDNLILFGVLGKAYKLPVSKIPFSAKGSNGYDLRMMIKKYVGEGICVMLPETWLSELDNMFREDNTECNLFILTTEGLFKRIKINEVFNIPISGLMYTKLNEGDKVKSLLAMNPYNEILLYNRNRVLRLDGTAAPLLNRSTKGNIGISTNTHPADGLVCIYPEATHVLAITENGYVNKVSLDTIPVGKRGQAGITVMKMNKTDEMNALFVCNDNDSLSVFTKRGEKIFPIKDIPVSSTVNPGTKMIDSSGIVSIGIIRAK